MHRLPFPAWFIMVAIGFCLLTPDDLPAAVRTARHVVKNEYHGVSVDDPYQWLEKADDPAVSNWTAAQNRAARAQLDRLPGRTDLETQLKNLYGGITGDYSALAVRR